MLWLGRRWRVELSGSKGYFSSEDVLFEKTLLVEPFSVLPEGLAMDSFVSLTVMTGVIIFCLRNVGYTRFVSGA